MPGTVLGDGDLQVVRHGRGPGNLSLYKALTFIGKEKHWPQELGT